MAKANVDFLKNMLLLKNPQFLPDHCETFTKGGPLLAHSVGVLRRTRKADQKCLEKQEKKSKRNMKIAIANLLTSFEFEKSIL